MSVVESLTGPTAVDDVVVGDDGARAAVVCAPGRECCMLELCRGKRERRRGQIPMQLRRGDRFVALTALTGSTITVVTALLGATASIVKKVGVASSFIVLLNFGFGLEFLLVLVEVHECLQISSLAWEQHCFK